MVLRLDPRIPVVWRDPFSLQFGVTNPVAVLREVSEADERMVAALTSGISRSGLTMIGRASGATDAEVEKLLAAVTPAMTTDAPEFVPTVVLAGVGPTADQIARDLATSGVRVRVARSPQAAEAERCDFAVIVGSFVLSPEYHGLWLRRDISHLPVVIGDGSTTIGPVVEPGLGPCLHCLNRYRIEADASWPAIATQLLGRRTVPEPPLVASEAAATASRMTVARLTEGATSVHTQVELDSTTGAAATRTIEPHPDCGCISLEVSA